MEQQAEGEGTNKTTMPSGQTLHPGSQTGASTSLQFSQQSSKQLPPEPKPLSGKLQQHATKLAAQAVDICLKEQGQDKSQSSAPGNSSAESSGDNEQRYRQDMDINPFNPDVEAGPHQQTLMAIDSSIPAKQATHKQVPLLNVQTASNQNCANATPQFSSQHEVHGTNTRGPAKPIAVIYTPPGQSLHQPSSIPAIPPIQTNSHAHPPHAIPFPTSHQPSLPQPPPPPRNAVDGSFPSSWQHLPPPPPPPPPLEPGFPSETHVVTNAYHGPAAHGPQSHNRNEPYRPVPNPSTQPTPRRSGLPSSHIVPSNAAMGPRSRQPSLQQGTDQPFMTPNRYTHEKKKQPSQAPSGPAPPALRAAVASKFSNMFVGGANQKQKLPMDMKASTAPMKKIQPGKLLKEHAAVLAKQAGRIKPMLDPTDKASNLHSRAKINGSLETSSDEGVHTTGDVAVPTANAGVPTQNGSDVQELDIMHISLGHTGPDSPPHCPSPPPASQSEHSESSSEPGVTLAGNASMLPGSSKPQADWVASHRVFGARKRPASHPTAISDAAQTQEKKQTAEAATQSDLPDVQPVAKRQHLTMIGSSSPQSTINQRQRKNQHGSNDGGQRPRPRQVRLQQDRDDDSEDPSPSLPPLPTPPDSSSSEQSTSDSDTELSDAPLTRHRMRHTLCFDRPKRKAVADTMAKIQACNKALTTPNVTTTTVKDQAGKEKLWARKIIVNPWDGTVLGAPLITPLNYKTVIGNVVKQQSGVKTDANNTEEPGPVDMPEHPDDISPRDHPPDSQPQVDNAYTALQPDAEVDQEQEVHIKEEVQDTGPVGTSGHHQAPEPVPVHAPVGAQSGKVHASLDSHAASSDISLQPKNICVDIPPAEVPAPVQATSAQAAIPVVPAQASMQAGTHMQANGNVSAPTPPVVIKIENIDDDDDDEIIITHETHANRPTSQGSSHQPGTGTAAGAAHGHMGNNGLMPGHLGGILPAFPAHTTYTSHGHVMGCQQQTMVAQQLQPGYNMHGISLQHPNGVSLLPSHPANQGSLVNHATPSSQLAFPTHNHVFAQHAQHIGSPGRSVGAQCQTGVQPTHSNHTLGQPSSGHQHATSSHAVAGLPPGGTHDQGPPTSFYRNVDGHQLFDGYYKIYLDLRKRHEMSCYHMQGIQQHDGKDLPLSVNVSGMRQVCLSATEPLITEIRACLPRLQQTMRDADEDYDRGNFMSCKIRVVGLAEWMSQLFGGLAP